MASTYLTRTPSSAGNKQKFTISAWIKKSSVGAAAHTIMCASNGGNRDAIMFDNNKLAIFKYDSGYTYKLRTTRLFRDSSAWYHIVVAFDTTLGTDSDRVKIYVNGEQVTTLESGWQTYPSVNFNTLFNDAFPQIIGKDWDSSNYFDGSMTHVSLVDGQALTPTSFGETDATSGIWKFKSPSGLSWGTNGFHLKFENDANLGLDSSGQTNNYTVSGNLKKALTTPTNVYATLNPNDTGYSSAVINLANANNTTMNTSGFGDYGIRSTFGVSKGKWYWECKLNYSGDGANTLGVLKMDKRLVINLMANPATADVFGIQRYNDSKTNIYNDGTFVSQNTAMWGGITSSDVIGFALDMDNGKLYLSKNGDFKDSSGNTGNPATQANPTFTGLDTGEYYGFYSEMRMNIDNGTVMNFGNGFFGTTAISSAGSNGNGSLFEYDVPSGYYALTTKNINTYG